MRLTIDFETRSPVDLKVSGAWRYAEHPDTDVLCLAVKEDEKPARIWTPPHLGDWKNYQDYVPMIDKDTVFGLLERAKQIEAHNAEFERAIWKRIMTPRYGWPEIPLHKWRCSAAKAAAFALPRSLEGAGAALGLPIQKDADGKKIMLKLCKPRAHPTPAQLRKEWQEEAKEWLAQDPVQGAVLNISKSGGISEKLILRDYDKDTVRELKAGRRGFIRPGGRLPPDQAAADYGFESLDALVEAVRSSKTPAKALTDYMDLLEQEWQYSQIKEGEALLWHEDRADLLALFRYCLQDVEAEHALSKALHDLNPTELRVWQLDQIINERGIQVDAAAARSVVKVLAEVEDKLLQELTEITNGAFKSVRQVEAFTKYCGLPDARKETVASALESPNLDPNIRRVLQIRQALSKASVLKFQAILNRVCSDGRLRGELKYHAATTGRWAGSGVQLQNLPRAGIPEGEVEPAFELFLEEDLEVLSLLYGDPSDLAKRLVRPTFCAGWDKDLISGDFAGIEARGLLWCAGDEDGLNLFRSGADIYCDMAGEIFGRPVTKKDKFERQIGKTAILGLGYGMGPAKFAQTCEIAGTPIEMKLARKTVQAYRSKYRLIQELWWATEMAAVKAVQTGKQIQVGRVIFGVRGKFLHCKLPSGRLLAYPFPQVQILPSWIFPTIDEDGETGRIMVVGEKTKSAARRIAEKRATDEEVILAGNPLEKEKAVLSFMGLVKGKWVRESTYGGKLVENIVQAICRDLMAAAMLRLEASGYPVVLTVHDECVSEIPENWGSVEEYEKLMCEAPSWAEGFPVAAEGWRGKRYRK